VSKSGDKCQNWFFLRVVFDVQVAGGLETRRCITGAGQGIVECCFAFFVVISTFSVGLCHKEL